MTYQLIEDYSCIWPTGPTSLEPKGFAIHWWGAGTPQFMPIVELLVNRAIQGSASIHFVAEAGRVACLTSPFEVAWGQGDGGTGWGNRNLVSIECNPRCSPEDRETVAELIADQHIRNGIPINLYPHNKFTATQCPGVWEQWIPWLTERAKQIVAEKTNSGETMAIPERWYAEMQQAQARIDTFVAEMQHPTSGIRAMIVANGIRAKYPNHEGIQVDSVVVLNSLDRMISKIVKGQPVVLTPEDVTRLAETIKANLAPGLATELAKRLAE